jgi:transposase, IS6 family
MSNQTIKVSYLDLNNQKVKYLNNQIEADHGKLKRLIKPPLGFKSMKTAFATIKGFKVMRMFKRVSTIYGKLARG